MSKDTIDEGRFGRFAKRIGTKLQFWSRQKRARAQVLKITKNLFAEFDRFMGRRQEKFKNVSWDTLWKFMISSNGMALPTQYAASLLNNQKTRSAIFAEWDKVKTSSGMTNPADSAKENWNNFIKYQDLDYPIGGDSNNNVSATLAELAVTYIFEMGAIRYIESKGQKKDKRSRDYDSFDQESLANLDVNRLNRRELVNVLQAVKKGKRFDDYDSFDQESLANLNINRMSRMNRRELINVLQAIRQDMGISSKSTNKKAAQATDQPSTQATGQTSTKATQTIAQQPKKSRSQATTQSSVQATQATAQQPKKSKPQATAQTSTASSAKPAQPGKSRLKPVSATMENSYVWASPDLVKNLRDKLNQYKTKKSVPENTIAEDQVKVAAKGTQSPEAPVQPPSGAGQPQSQSQSQATTSPQKPNNPPFTSGIKVLDSISAREWQKRTPDEWVKWYESLVNAFDKLNKIQIENMKKIAAAIKANDDAAIDTIKNLIRSTKFNARNYRIVRNLLLNSKLANDVKKHYVKLLGEFPPTILSEHEFISLSKMLQENKLTWKNLGYSSVYRNKDMGTVILFESGTSGGTSSGNIASIPNAGGPMMPVIRRMPPGQSFFAPQVAKRTKKKAKKSS